MRPLSFLLLLVLLCVSCGYVGPVLPPSPEIPLNITDLAAVERADKLLISFSTPARTTDGVAIRMFSTINLRVTPNDSSRQGKDYAIDLPPPSDPEDPQPKAISYAIPVSEWVNQRISIAVRTAVKKEGHLSSWSNQITMDVIAPLARPDFRAVGTAEGIVLTWPASPDTQYQIQRQSSSDKQPIELAVVNEGRYVDVSSQFDTEYRYSLTARKGTAESEPSEPITFSSQDKYPPGVPSGLTVLASAASIDLAWQRNAETDFQSYFIYRSTNGGPFERLPDPVALPTYSDRNVEHGKTYSYKVSAVDKNGNESALSSAVETPY